MFRPRRLLVLAGLTLIVGCGDSAPSSADADPSTRETTMTAARPAVVGIADQDIAALLQAQLAGDVAAAELVRRVVADVAARDEVYNAVLLVNEAAEAQAAALDVARTGGAEPGPLHGIPVMVKDNIETADMPTTAGALALEGNATGRDAPVVARLRAAGAVIVAKTNLSEWANFRSERSSSGWSGIGGQTRNAVDPSRTPCGSSSGSGVAVALGYVPLAIGTETNGSIVCPSAVNGVVGFKPTHGQVPGEGIAPIAHTQDTAGPMARTVADAALGYAVLADRSPGAVLAEVRAGDLAGKRLGVVRSAMGYHEGVDAVFAAAAQALAAAGAVLVDDLELNSYDEFGTDTYEVLLHEFRTDLDAWLASLPDSGGIDSLEDVIAFNEANAEASMPWFRQEILVKAAERGPLTDPAYLEAYERIQRATGPEGIDALMAAHDLDALIAPTGGAAWPIDLVNGDHFLGGFSTFPAVSGAPHLTVPMGRLHGLPVGLSFVARRDADLSVLALGHAWEALDARADVGPPLPGEE